MTPKKKRKAAPAPTLLPLGALAAGFGLALGSAQAQTATPENKDTTLAPIKVKAQAENAGKDAYQATETRIGKGVQELRDVPQSITVVTEKLIDDRNLDTLKDALKNTAGISFQAAEGGEEDIRLRGFSLQSTGDIFIDGMRDPAFYDRDSFNWDRLEVLRGSASMLFGRGSTGGAVNQVSKQPMLINQNELAITIGNGEYARVTGDFNLKTGENAALRLNVMNTAADQWGNKIDKQGIAPTLRWGIGTADEFSAGLYHLQNDNGIHYGLPWLAPGAGGGDFLWNTDPKNYYGLKSDYARSGTTQGNFSHIHRFGGPSQGELRTALRIARYDRDQRASAIRFCTQNNDPSCPAEVTKDNFGPDTVLRRSGDTGVQAKVMDMDTRYLQSDYSGRFDWGGLKHSVQAGADLAREDFDNFAVAQTSPELIKPRTTVGTPNDGASVDEAARQLVRNRTFEARALGFYAQDLLQVAPAWKLLAGLRWDKMDGTYRNLVATGGGGGGGNNPCTVQPGTTLERSDSLWSKRFGVLYQPNELQSYHLSYGTSFNTSGDTYQYDAGTAQTAPESSRNIELGAKIDSAGGNMSTRIALFHSTKYNERNRDSESVNACNYVLSGERHAAGVELDLSGRITPAWEIYGSYAYIPVAKVDSSSGAQGTEAVGSRPGLTPKHTGTLWTTYKITPKWRVGAGLNARSGDKPAGLAPDSLVRASKFITADAMAEYSDGPVSFKLNVTNIADEHYADQLYRGHYIPGKPRTIQLTTALKF
ncbi:MAG: TonB-dependent siderophore receptor [Piscinibacter sp.]